MTPLSLLKDRLQKYANGDVAIRPCLLWSYLGIGLALLFSGVLVLAMRAGTPLSVPLGFMFFMLCASLYIGYHSYFNAWVRFEKDALVIGRHILKPRKISKTDVVEMTPFEKGCARYFVLADGSKVKVGDFDVVLVGQEFRRWKKSG